MGSGSAEYAGRQRDTRVATNIVFAIVIPVAIMFLLCCYRGFDHAQKEVTSPSRLVAAIPTAQEKDFWEPARKARLIEFPLPHRAELPKWPTRAS
jgi:hypothetical protein